MMPDLDRLAAERLYSLGTDRAVTLAQEIERGIRRREDDVIPKTWTCDGCGITYPRWIRYVHWCPWSRRGKAR